MESVTLYIVLTIGTLFLSYLGVVGLRGWAAQRMPDMPNERSSHSQPIPRGGGLPIVVCTLVGIWATVIPSGSSLPRFTILLYSLGATLIAIVSWFDDLHSVPNRVRFGVQAFGALLVLLLDGFWRRPDIPFLASISLGWLAVPIGFLWIVGFTNAYNFMDGIDGIAGGQAVIAGSAWAGLGILAGYPPAGVIGALVAAASLGFLACNWPPARIFMGDVGSAFIGYTFACLPVIAGNADPRLPFAGILVVWPFVLDSTFTLLRRLSRGENIFAAHRSHLYQRLVISGYSHRFVTLLYMGLALVGAILAFVWVLRIKGSDCLALFVPILLFGGLFSFVGRSERRHYFSQ